MVVSPRERANSGRETQGLVVRLKSAPRLFNQKSFAKSVPEPPTIKELFGDFARRKQVETKHTENYDL